MITKFYCEFCGKEFTVVSECVDHERSHNSLFIDADRVQDNGLSTSGNRAGTAPALVYVPLFRIDKNKNIERLWGRYNFCISLTQVEYDILAEEGEIVSCYVKD